MPFDQKSRTGFDAAFSTPPGPAITEPNRRVGVATKAAGQSSPIRVALLTGGNDRPYALGLASALVSQRIFTDFIASDALDSPELRHSPLINFLNLRGDQSEQANLRRKIVRLLRYYARLLWYAAVSKPRIFHILWNNKFEVIDRVVLMLYYRLLGKRIVFTAHNVNAAKRDGKDTLLNRLSLGFQYWMSNHIFVHTQRMKNELLSDFRLPQKKVTVIPFGINNTVPTSQLTIVEAKEHLGIRPGEKAALFFGQIAPYKGLEYLISAMSELMKQNEAPWLIIAGKVKRGAEDYWRDIEHEIIRGGVDARIIQRIKFIPDPEVELYFKAADVVIISYVEIFQSGVPFLAYSFGLPVIATDVGSLRENVVEGRTGYICKPRNADDLAEKIRGYFTSDLYQELGTRRVEIMNFANEKYSWTKIGEATRAVYCSLIATFK